VGGDENNKRFFAHKVVLCGRSAYFRGLLTGGMGESHEKEIQLHKVNPEAFSIVLEYLYTKNLNVVGHEMSNEQIIETFSLATEYGVEPLRFKLETMLELRIDVENVCSLLVFSDIHRAVKVGDKNIMCCVSCFYVIAPLTCNSKLICNPNSHPAETCMLQILY